MKKRKIAIVYDWMDSWGGVERLLLTLNEMYPDASWFTSYVDPKRAEWTDKILNTKKKVSKNQVDKNTEIQTSFIQKFPSFIRKSRLLSLFFYPFAFESFNFNGFDLVLTVSSSFAKGIITQPGTKHVCILLTPTRWLWGMTEETINLKILKLNSENTSRIKEQNLITILLKPIVGLFRNWDLVASTRPDEIISISQTVADRCKKYYGRKSNIVYPPFDQKYWGDIKIKIHNKKSKALERFRDLGLLEEIRKSNYFLLVSRLETYKRVDLAIQAFKKLKDKKLIIIGKGTQYYFLNKIMGKNTAIINGLTDEELAYVYSNAQALIMPQEEDFGYVALESQFFGCPVIAYKGGGARETIKDGKTGILFNSQSLENLTDAVADFNPAKYNLKDAQVNLTKFSKEKFVTGLQKIIDTKVRLFCDI